MTSTITLVLGGWAAAAALMAVLWMVQRARGNAGIVDVAWSLATAGLGAGLALAADGDPRRRGLIALMVGVWGLRLGVHLWARVSREAEDGRYRQLRDAWGDAAGRNLFVFYQVQALWAVLFALPMLAAAASPAPLGTVDAIGVALWLVAVIGETVADRQLARFKADPARSGGVCRDGLWRYSRHPNYFFEWIHWWAYCALGA